MKTRDISFRMGGTPKSGSDVQLGDFLTGPSKSQRSLVRLSPGTILLDRFKIEKQLGNGRFASVYLAEDRLRESEIALKIIEVGPCSEALSRVQLKRETDAYSKISNFEYVVRIYDLHYAPWGGTGLLVLSMDYAEGGTFRKWLIEHKDDLKARQTTGLEYFKQACRGVSATHSAHTVNLDLKPENLLFSGGVLKVSDFGTAVLGQVLQQNSASIAELPSIEVGTPLYMSPEHFITAHPDDLDRRADIYSLGIILYELLHPKCRPPFGGSVSRLRELHLTFPAPRLAEAGENMAHIVAQCLEKDPVDRYQSVDELLNDLEYGHSHNAPVSPKDADEEALLYRIEAAWEEASFCFSEGDLNEVRKLLEEVLRMDPEHDQAQQLKAEIEKRFDHAKQLYEEIQNGLDGTGLEQLIHLMKEAVDAYPDHPDGILIQSKLHKKAETYREYWEKASQSFRHQNFDEAAHHLKEVLRTNPTDVTAKKLLEELGERSAEAQRFYKDIETGLEKGEDLNALVKMITEAANLHPDYPEGRLVQFKLAQKVKTIQASHGKRGCCIAAGILGNGLEVVLPGKEALP